MKSYFARARIAVATLLCASLAATLAAAQSEKKARQDTTLGRGILLAKERRIVFGDRSAETLMLTGDENLVDIGFEVYWASPATGGNVQRHARLAAPESIVRDMSMSIMSELVGQRTLSELLTGDRSRLQNDAVSDIQRALDASTSFVAIVRVAVTRVDPPRATLDAFRDVQAAQQDVERFRNDAERYANRAITEARGAAAKTLEDAETAYAEQILTARLEAERFKALAEGYRKAPDHKSRRLYIEALRLIPE